MISRKKELLGVDEANLLSCVTFSWLSRFMYRAYRKGLTVDDIPEGSPLDSCNYNVQRYKNQELLIEHSLRTKVSKVLIQLEQQRFKNMITNDDLCNCLKSILNKAIITARLFALGGGFSAVKVAHYWRVYPPLVSVADFHHPSKKKLEKLWNDEISVKGQRDASFGNVIWRFIRTRVFLSCFVFSLNLLTGFISVTVCMRSLIKFAESPDAHYSEGIKWAIILGVTETFRTFFYSTTWAISYRTATRLRSACLTLLYKKVIRLNSLGDNSVGGLINLFANDSQRIFDMVLFGPMIMGGPITMTFGIFYIFWLLGPWALLGMLIFTIFYPIQYGMSRCVGYFRSKTMAVGDKRIRLVSEILSCIKLIKMYAWEKCFSKYLEDIRNKEMRLLRLTAYCNSLTMSLATTVPIISAIVTFLSHIAAGNNLTASAKLQLGLSFLFFIQRVYTSPTSSWQQDRWL